MGYTLQIYTEDVYREIRLPMLDNADYDLCLKSEEFLLRGNIVIQMEVMDGIWRVKDVCGGRIDDSDRSSDHGILCQGGFFKIFVYDVQISILVWENASEMKAWPKYRVVNSGEMRIGRGEENDICCSSLRIVSQKHVIFSVSGNRAYITDISLNGTYLNGYRIHEKTELHFGDVVSIFGLSVLWLSGVLAVGSLDGNLIINPDCLKQITGFSREPENKLPEKAVEAETIVHAAPRSLPDIYEGTEKIEPTPAKHEPDTKPAWMTVLPSLTMMIPMVIGFSLMGSNMKMGLVIAVGSAVVGFTWALINLRYSRKEQREKEMLRLERYEEYLVQCADRIREKFEYNRQAQIDLYPDAETCSRYTADMPVSWARSSRHSDFLFIRLGLGDMPFQVNIQIPEKGFMLFPDELAERPGKIADSYRIMHEVPLGIGLAEYGVGGILSADRGRRMSVARTILSQIAANYSYTEVKIAALFDGNGSCAQQWNALKWLPHVWNEERTFRYMASDPDEISEVLYALLQKLRDREEQMGMMLSGKKKVLVPHYVLFVESSEMLESQIICKYLYEQGTSLGISTIFVTDSYNKLPGACSFIIEDSPEFCGIYGMEEEDRFRKKINFDSVSPDHFSSMARRMAPWRVNEVESSHTIPSSLTFFEMMGVQSLPELKVIECWKKNRTYESMRALVGQKSGGAGCYLDIHEKFHGPHGLVAGTTGSGKSETLQTYILSLAVNFSPLDVGFFIIDFKGGGMANLFSRLPHMLGQISNLSGNQVRRAMISIKSENSRRQRIFGESGVNNINDYTRLVKNGEASEPLPHLLIVIDEFAELKREHPDFMKELISVAQVGRSLGVHLILATQKPSGTVDDNIWSNTKFKLCLRVADKQDSNDMLHRPDAAFLTQAGRCYLQVGNDEIFELFQSGWSGAIYDADCVCHDSGAIMLNLPGREAVISRSFGVNTEERTLRWVTEVVTCILGAAKELNISLPDPSMDSHTQGQLVRKSIRRINSRLEQYTPNPVNNKRIEDLLAIWPEEGTPENIAGQLIASAKERNQKLPEQKEIRQLDAVVNYLAEIAEKNGFTQLQPLWMPVLPTQLYLDQLEGYQEGICCGGTWKAHEGLSVSAMIGLVDAPEMQRQFPLNIDFVQNGHLVIVGGVTSGKSTVMQTIIFSLIRKYSPEELSVYAIDYSSQMLCPFEKSAHMGGIVLEGEDNRLNKLFGMLLRLLKERKQAIKGGSFSQYIQLHGHSMPAILLAIDGYANFRDKTGDAYEAALMELVREAEGYGIYLMISCGGFGGTELQNKIADKMRQSMCLELSDKYKYGEVLHISHFDLLPETNVKGRGLVSLDDSVFEYQAALACAAENDYQRSELIAEICAEMTERWNGVCAAAIPEIPAKPTWDTLREHPSFRKQIQSGSSLPCAYDQETADVYGISLNKLLCYLVLGQEQTGKSTFLRNIACAAKEMGGEVYVIDCEDGRDALIAGCSGAEYASNAAEMFEAVKRLVLLTNERGVKRRELQQRGLDDEEISLEMRKSFPAVFYIISNLADFIQRIYTRQEGIGLLNDRIEVIFAKGKLLNVYFFAALDINEIGLISARPAWQSFIRDHRGVLLGGELNKQNIFAYQNIRYNEQGRRMKNGQAYAVNPENPQQVDLITVPQNRGVTVND
ncbi:MAG: FHA domain-containing protein [Clostridiales bacterium]|nr:FHA domain-containing protein [Clostridiales bacterium]